MPNNLRINQKLENAPLRELFMKRASTDANSPEANELINVIINEIIMNARLICPVTISGGPQLDENGEYTVSNNTDITFTLLNHSNGQHFFPIFTESSELEKWEGVGNAENLTTAQFSFDHFANMVQQNGTIDGIAINPFSDNITVKRDLVANWYRRKQIMKNGHAQHVISSERDYEFVPLDPYPMVFSNKLCESAKTISEIKKVWLRGIRLNGDIGYLVIAEADVNIAANGDKMNAFTRLGDSVKQYLEGKYLHMVAYGSDFSKEAVDKMLPIYSRN